MDLMLGNIKKYVLTSFVMCGIATVIALGVMFIAYSIPIDWVRSNVKESAVQMASDGYFRESVKNTTGAGIDNFSLSFSLGHIIFDDGYSFLEKVMLNPSYEYGVPKHYDVLNTINKVPGGKIHIYGRYWHGNVFFLKIAHIWFDLEDIRIINLILQNLLLLAVLYLICKKLNIFYALSYLMAILFMNPGTLAYSLPFSPICYLMYIFSILVLLLDKRYIDWKLFLVFGCCTSFLDFLTFPLVVLCFPLLLMINIYHQNLIQDIKKIIGYSLSWGCGYLGLWMSKFFVATIFTDENIIKHGWDSIRHRLYGYHVPDVDWNFAWALENNFNEYAKIVNVWIVCLFAVAFLGCVIFSKVSFRKSYIVAVNILIGLYPFVWCLIVQNHSIEHSGSVYRIFTISILAIGFLLSCCIKDSRYFENENVENK